MHLMNNEKNIQGTRVEMKNSLSNKPYQNETNPTWYKWNTECQRHSTQVTWDNGQRSIADHLHQN